MCGCWWPEIEPSVDIVRRTHLPQTEQSSLRGALWLRTTLHPCCFHKAQHVIRNNPQRHFYRVGRHFGVISYCAVTYFVGHTVFLTNYENVKQNGWIHKALNKMVTGYGYSASMIISKLYIIGPILCVHKVMPHNYDKKPLRVCLIVRGETPDFRIRRNESPRVLTGFPSIPFAVTSRARYFITKETS